MRADAKGNAFESRGRWYARASLGGGKRPAVLLPTCSTEEEADLRAAFISELVGQIRRAGKAEIVDLEKVIREAANASSDKQLADLKLVVREVRGNQALPTGKHSAELGSTFKSVGQAWTNGDLARMYPDHVRVKRTAKDDE